jgi:hypothetical protein
MREAAKTRAPPRKPGSSSIAPSGSRSKSSSSHAVDSKDKDSTGWGTLLQGQSIKDSVKAETSSQSVVVPKAKRAAASKPRSSSNSVTKTAHLKQQRVSLIYKIVAPSHVTHCPL